MVVVTLRTAAALAALALALASPSASAFAPPLTAFGSKQSSSFVQGRTNTVVASMTPELVASALPPALSSVASSSATTFATSALSSSPDTTSLLLSFSDQGGNLAGTFFQASLLPYLAFLYFLGFRGNRTPDLGNFGWQYLLLFVLGTIPSGIVTKGFYGESLANVDWLHGGAEALLTITNVLIVSFKAGS